MRYWRYIEKRSKYERGERRTTRDTWCLCIVTARTHNFSLVRESYFSRQHHSLARGTCRNTISRSLVWTLRSLLRIVASHSCSRSRRVPPQFFLSSSLPFSPTVHLSRSIRFFLSLSHPPAPPRLFALTRARDLRRAHQSHFLYSLVLSRGRRQLAGSLFARETTTARRVYTGSLTRASCGPVALLPANDGPPYRTHEIRV